MTGWVGPGTNLPLSRITIGSLADLGYSVNFAAADNFSPTIATTGALLSAVTSSATSNVSRVRDSSPLSPAQASVATRREALPWVTTEASADQAFSRLRSSSHAEAVDLVLADWT